MQVALTGMISAEDGNVPTEFVLVQAGSNAYDGGEFVFDEIAASSVMSTWKKRGIRLTADYEHQSLNAHKMQGLVPASVKSWVPKIEDGKLLASDVKWTPKARAAIADGEISYFSILGDVDTKTKRLVSITNFALTNLPRAHGLQPLAASVAFSEPQKDNDMKSVTLALGLRPDADESEALVALSSMKDFEREVITTLGKKSRNEALGALVALSAQAAESVSLKSELADIKAAQKTAEVASLIDNAVKDGRVPPAKRESMVALSQVAGIEGLKACLELLPKLALTSTEAVSESKAVMDGAEILSPAEIKIALTMGNDLEELRKSKRDFIKEQEAIALSKKVD